MSGSWRDWPVEQRELPEAQRAAGREFPRGGVEEIDRRVLPSDDSWAPIEAVVGVFEIGDDGDPTGRYFRNPEHGPIRDDFTPFDGLEPQPWFPDDTPRATKGLLEELFASNVAGSTLEWVKFRGEVKTIVGGPKNEDGTKVTVRRSAYAVEFVCSVVAPGHPREFLGGVVTFAVTGLDDPGNARQRGWLDLAREVPVEKALALMEQRVYEIDTVAPDWPQEKAEPPKRRWFRRR